MWRVECVADRGNSPEHDNRRRRFDCEQSLPSRSRSISVKLMTGGQPVGHRSFEWANNQLTADITCIVFDRKGEVNSCQC